MENPVAEMAKTLPYSNMATLTGLHENTLRKVAKMNNEQLKKTEIGTYVILKNKLNIDLAKNIKY